MKKWMALCLVGILCVCAASSYAATWGEGLSPQKPYSGSPEIDFEKSIGYMMLFPVNNSNVLPGTNILSIFMPREDVKTGSGTLYLSCVEDETTTEMVIDSQSLVARPMTEEELDNLLWGCGTVFEIELDQELAPNRHYFVQLTEGSILAPDYDIASPAIAGEDAWTFNTEIPYYVESMVYCRMVEGQDEPEIVEDVQVGDKAKISIVLGEEGKYASVFCNKGNIFASQSYFEENAQFMISFPIVGDVEWGINFVDENGNTLYSMTYHTKVSGLKIGDQDAAREQTQH